MFSWSVERPSSHIKITKMGFGPITEYLSGHFFAGFCCREGISCFFIRKEWLSLDFDHDNHRGCKKWNRFLRHRRVWQISLCCGKSCWRDTCWAVPVQERYANCCKIKIRNKIALVCNYLLFDCEPGSCVAIFMHLIYYC